MAHSKVGHHHVLRMDRATVSTVRQDNAGMTICGFWSKSRHRDRQQEPHRPKNRPIAPRLYEARMGAGKWA